ncbi:helix-turn-helix domain-containing protein, partial [Flavicella sediminum]|uniref:helix-turn-helix domain-containing protein n=1 Tax=Flavicella sediminum TaxID=2585141 RepID=UPI00111F7CFA
MDTKQNQPCRKNNYEKVTFQHKLLVIDQILNGQISVNFAAKKFNISRSTISYWLKNHCTLQQQKTGMSKLDEI